LELVAEEKRVLEEKVKQMERGTKMVI